MTMTMMMTTKIQRLTSTFRSLALNSFHSISPNSSSHSLFNLPRSLHSHCRSFATERISILSSSSSSSSSSLGFQSLRRSSPFPLSTVQVRFRHYTKRDRGNKRRRFTPAVSKVKKTKMKPYSSYAQRFELLKDGTIKRWKAGKRHNAHAKSKEAKRRLRRTTLVHPTYARTMKKLNFGA